MNKNTLKIILLASTSVSFSSAYAASPQLVRSTLTRVIERTLPEYDDYDTRTIKRSALAKWTQQSSELCGENRYTVLAPLKLSYELESFASSAEETITLIGEIECQNSPQSAQVEIEADIEQHVNISEHRGDAYFAQALIEGFGRYTEPLESNILELTDIDCVSGATHGGYLGFTSCSFKQSGVSGVRKIQFEGWNLSGTDRVAQALDHAYRRLPMLPTEESTLNGVTGRGGRKRVKKLTCHLPDLCKVVHL